MQKRPSDQTILIGKMLFGMIIIGSLYYNLITQWDGVENNFFGLIVPAEYVHYIKYGFIALGVVPVITGLLKICLLKKKWVRIIQIVYAIFLFYVSTKIVPLDPNRLDVDVLLFFIAFIPLIGWITGKCITSNCLKFGEKLVKIRV